MSLVAIALVGINVVLVTAAMFLLIAHFQGHERVERFARLPFLPWHRLVRVPLYRRIDRDRRMQVVTAVSFVMIAVLFGILVVRPPLWLDTTLTYIAMSEIMMGEEVMNL